MTQKNRPRNLERFFRDACRIQTCDLLIRSQMLYSAELRRRPPVIGLFFGRDFTLCFLDACLLACKIAEVEDAGPAYLTDFVHLDAVDCGRLIRENSLDSDSAGYLADGERPGVGSSSTYLDNYAAETLKSLFVTLLDTIGNGDGVTSLELRVRSRFVLRKSLLYNVNKIHNFKFTVSSVI